MKWLEKKWLIMAVLAIMVYAFSATTVFAVPLGANVSEVSTSRGSDPSETNLTAEAGNVTQVTLNQTTITEKWQGYYGNVTGELSLENSGGSVFYDWSLASPTGEIYASRDSAPTFGSMTCADQGEVTTEESALGITTADTDSINSTYYLGGNHSLFSVGTTDFTVDQCLWRTNAYVSSASQNVSFDQIILHDGGDTVYTTVINQDTAGFDGSNWDFELLVPVNSTGMPYFFFAEIA